MVEMLIFFESVKVFGSESWLCWFWDWVVVVVSCFMMWVWFWVNFVIFFMGLVY